MSNNRFLNAILYNELTKEDRLQVLHDLRDAISANVDFVSPRAYVDDDEVVYIGLHSMTHREYENYLNSGGIWDYIPPEEVLSYVK